ncbi:MAG: cytochrome c oxidase subunit II [Actinomycetota bacterium]
MSTLPVTTKRRLLIALLGVVALFLVGCAADAPQDVLKPEGPISRDQDSLWDITFGIAVVVFVIVQGLLVYAIVRFRARPGREAAQFHGNTKVEVLLTVVPALILAGLAVPTVRTIFDLSGEREGSLRVTVIARQFWWEYQYEDEEVFTANELHIPVGRPVYLKLMGEDVIHSYWIPALGGKQDVVPGRINYLTYQADKEGVYRGQCTEYCGLSHANMRIVAYAQSPEEFDQWVEDQQAEAESPTDSLAQQGEDIFLEGECINCHAIAGTDAQARTAPDLTHFASRDTFAGAMFRNTDENLAAWLDDPPAVKPGAKMPDYGLTADEIDALVAYLQSLE